jgi:hypothetical protein
MLWIGRFNLEEVMTQRHYCLHTPEGGGAQVMQLLFYKCQLGTIDLNKENFEGRFL